MTQCAFGGASCSLWGRTLAPCGIPWGAVWSNCFTFFVMLCPHRFADDFAVDFRRVLDPEPFDFAGDVLQNLSFTEMSEISDFAYIFCRFGMPFGIILTLLGVCCLMCCPCVVLYSPCRRIYRSQWAPGIWYGRKGW